jgi:MoaA/NifB/PqqE/SkfB family radical SAM enzyme
MLDLARLTSRIRGRSEQSAPADRSDEINELGMQSEAEIRAAITQYEKDEIKNAFTWDVYTRNFLLNLWECENQVDTLESYPWNIALPIADVCNARCTFCSSWLLGKSVMTPAQLKPYLEILPYARLIGFQGHGEPLANPHLPEILTAMAAVIDPRAQGYVITNGVFMAKYLDALLRSRISVFNISLNATTAKTHEIVMGLGEGTFDIVLDNIRNAIALRETTRPDIRVAVSMVLTADNIHEAADFVKLGNDLGVDKIYLRTLMTASTNIGPDGEVTYEIPGLNYHLLPPKLHPDFEHHAERAREAVRTSAVEVETQPETWHLDALSPASRAAVEKKPLPFIERSAALLDKSVREANESATKERLDDDHRGTLIREVFDLLDNPYGREAPFSCRFVYQNLITTQLTFSIYPCCYMQTVPGYTSLVLSADVPFMSLWNADAMVNLRRRLREGPLYQACATCPMQG